MISNEAIALFTRGAPQNEEEAQLFLHEYEGHTVPEMAEAYKKGERTMRRWRKKAEEILGHKSKNAIRAGQYIKGQSVLYDKDNNPILNWVKTDKKVDDLTDHLVQVVNRLRDRIEPVEPRPLPEPANSNLCSLYVITDYHLGLLNSHGEELLIKWFKEAIYKQRNSDVAVFCQLGDFLHYDSMEPVTPTSGHVLETNMTFYDMVDAAIRVQRKIIQMLLDNHSEVYLYNCEGNHDYASSVWLRKIFNQFYSDEPRLIVDDTEVPYYAFEWGDTALFFHHGHKCRVNKIAPVFVNNYREIYGRTKHAYGHVGHLHHKHKETKLMVVEQHNTLAAASSFEKNNGYSARREATVIKYHKQYGEVERSTISPEMLK